VGVTASAAGDRVGRAAHADRDTIDERVRRGAAVQGVV